jgi:hypothetical protein
MLILCGIGLETAFNPDYQKDCFCYSNQTNFRLKYLTAGLLERNYYFRFRNKFYYNRSVY